MGTYSIEQQILNHYHLSHKSPLRPVWGEIFYLLYQIKRQAEKMKMEKRVYELQGGYVMIYRPERKRFVVTVDGIQFSLKICELTTSLLQGMFLPSIE